MCLFCLACLYAIFLWLSSEHTHIHMFFLSYFLPLGFYFSFYLPFIHFTLSLSLSMCVSISFSRQIHRISLSCDLMYNVSLNSFFYKTTEKRKQFYLTNWPKCVRWTVNFQISAPIYRRIWPMNWTYIYIYICTSNQTVIFVCIDSSNWG